MRKISAIIAFCCLLFLNAGYYVLYQFQLFEIKEGMKSELRRARRNELTQFKFSTKEAADLNWEEQTEFRYQGEMYDVVEIEPQGDSIVVHCLVDKKEKALKEEYARTHTNSNGKSRSASIFKMLKLPYLPSSISLLPFNVTAGVESSGYYLKRLPFSFHQVLLPPPKVC